MPALLEQDDSDLEVGCWTEESEDEDSDVEYERQVAKLAQEIAKAETFANDEKNKPEAKFAQDTAKAETFANKEESKQEVHSSPGRKHQCQLHARKQKRKA